MSVCPGSLWEKVLEPTSYRYAWKTGPQVFCAESQLSANNEAKEGQGGFYHMQQPKTHTVSRFKDTLCLR